MNFGKYAIFDEAKHELQRRTRMVLEIETPDVRRRACHEQIHGQPPH